MTPEAASHIIEQLALGTDPRTGEILAPGDACTAPEIIRALFIARTALQGAPAAPSRTPRHGTGLENAGKRWSEEDGDALLHAYAGGTTIRDIARQLGRTEASIIARLVHAGALPDREAGYARMREDREREGREGEGRERKGGRETEQAVMSPFYFPLPERENPAG